MENEKGNWKSINGGPWIRLPDYEDVPYLEYWCPTCGKKCGGRFERNGFDVIMCSVCRPLRNPKIRKRLGLDP
jgi:hypothetical protein